VELEKISCQGDLIHFNHRLIYIYIYVYIHTSMSMGNRELLTTKITIFCYIWVRVILHYI